MSEPVKIENADQLARCIIFNPIFSGDIHTDSALWAFGKRDQHGVSHHSGVLRRFAPNENDVHEIGCKIAGTQNAEKAEPPPGDKRRYYCGFRNAVVGDIPLEVPGRFRVELFHKEENGIEAHVDVALTVVGPSKQEAANQRTEAGMLLAEAFGAPVPHICECDNDDEMHPLKRWGPECLTKGLSGPFTRLVSPGAVENIPVAQAATR